jgi:hypothetical protein
MQRSDRVRVGEALPGWRALRDEAVLVLVGLTGVGKSTTLEAVLARTSFTVLPDRRTLTDAVILGGEAITDRAERFRRTAAYRASHPGGMAGVLETLSVAESGDLLFDGLRGLEEVQHAAAHLPKARFVALHAPDTVRVARLLGRADTFDRLEVGAVSKGTLEALLGIDGIQGVFNAGELEHLAALPYPSADVVAKTTIVVTERQHYDPAPVNALLETLPRARALVLNTTTATPIEIAAQINHWWSAT